MKLTRFLKPFAILSIGIYAQSLATAAVGETKIYTDSEEQPENIQTKSIYSNVELLSQSGYQRGVHVMISEPGSLTTENLTMNNSFNSQGCEISLSSGSLIVTHTLTMSNANNQVYANDLTRDTSIRIDGGTAYFNKIVFGNSLGTNTGRSMLNFNSGHTTVGQVLGGEHSDIIIGSGGGISSLTMNGSITTNMMTVYQDFGSINITDQLLGTQSKGKVTLFTYDGLSAVEGRETIFYEGHNITVTDTQANLYQLLQQSIEHYNGKDYDLSNAKVEITYDKTDGYYYYEGGTMSITGVKPIPEPCSAILGLGGLSLLLLRRRR